MGRADEIEGFAIDSFFIVDPVILRPFPPVAQREGKAGCFTGEKIRKNE